MLSRLRTTLRGLFLRRRVESELDEELRFHLEKEIEQNQARGMSQSDARRAALRDFGGLQLFKEQARDVRGVRWLDDFFQDVRFGLRMMRKSPGFTLIAALSLAIGIGANTALFSVVDAVYLRTLPVKEPERLVLFEWQAGQAFRTTGKSGHGMRGWPEGKRGSSSFHYRVLERFRAQDGPLSDLFGFADLWELNVRADDQADMAVGMAVSGNYYDGLGVEPMLGRTIAPDDDRPGAPPVAMLSYRYWRDRFGADPGVIGKQLAINQNQFTVVGVTPPAFTGTLQVDTFPQVTVPISLEPIVDGARSKMASDKEPGIWFVYLMGRLKPGATIAQARESLAGVFEQTALELMPPPSRENDVAILDPGDYPELLTFSGSRGMLESRQNYFSTVYLLFGVVGLVLLIACANVANLLLSRAASRGAEITLRLAIGAGRGRLMRQLLTESLLLAAVGGTGGVFLGLWGKSLLAALGHGTGHFLPADVDYHLNLRVLGFSLGVSLVTGVFFGIAPAWRATRTDLNSALKEGNRGLGGIARSRLPKVLVIVQVALSLVLLVGAGLFVRTVLNLQHIDLGFNQQNLLVFNLQPGLGGRKPDQLFQYYREVLSRFDTIPGVRAATFGRVPLIADYMSNTNIILPGESPQAVGHPANLEIIRENYLAAMQIPLLRGRAFTERDDAAGRRVALINQTFSQKYFPDQDPIGKIVSMPSGNNETMGYEIVGVVGDTKYNSQREDIEPLFYTPWLQEPRRIGTMYFALRTAGDPSAIIGAVRDAVRDVDSGVPITGIKTQVAQSNETLAGERVFAQLLSFFGGIALLLAVIGLYGVLAYSVSQRTGEIGIRMALGARTDDVLKMVIWQGMKLVMIGLVLGLAGAVALKKVVSNQLYGIQPTDPVTIVAVAALLSAAALLACSIPGRRATKVDPIVALRYE